MADVKGHTLMLDLDDWDLILDDGGQIVDTSEENGGDIMTIPKGYTVPDGYMGLLKGKYILFATYGEYLEILREMEGGK